MSLSRSLLRHRARAVSVILALASLAAVAPEAFAQQTAAPSAALKLDALVPADPKAIVGTLPNGLRYYIRKNDKPEKRAELRLIVNAGSILEDDDQRGMAHFVEHMAFNGSTHFAKNELVSYLESIGVRFGADLNASTNFDETVYILPIPTDTAKIVDKAFQILEDWAHGVTFDSAEVVRERGIVLEEWRLNQGASMRVGKVQRDAIFKGSRYATRLPIGEKQDIEHANVAALKRFYRDWYRPDLMAVVAVGDFDPASMERLIKQHFAGIPKATSPRPRTLFSVPDNEAPIVATATDKEAGGSTISVLFKRPVHAGNTVGDFRKELIESLYGSMFNARLAEIAQQADAPFFGAGAGGGRFIRTLETYNIGANVKDGGMERGLEAVLTEIRRVDQFGFTASELERAKSNMLRSVERAYAERDKTSSGAYVGEFLDNFLTGEPLVSIETSYELSKQLVPAIKVDEVNRVARDVITDRNRVILAAAPQKEGVALPTEKQLLAVFDRASKATVTAYTEKVSDAPLLAALPPAGRIVSEKQIADLGITDWRLSNGVRVLLKPTDFKADQILMSATSPGGTSLVADSDYVSASLASLLVGGGGIANFGPLELQKKLAGKAVGVGPSIEAYSEGVGGQASPKDLETLMQLTHLEFTAPRVDSAFFAALRSQFPAILANRSSNPDAVFSDTINVTLSMNHPRARPISEKLLAELDLQTALRVYRDRFADAGGFTFVFVGNFDVDSMRPLVQRYLASLPATGRKETWKDIGIHRPTGVVTRTVYKGLEPKATTRIFFSGPFVQSRANGFALTAMSDIFEIRLREQLREALGGTYGVGVNGSNSRIPRSEYTVGIDFGSAPERVDQLVAAVFATIDSLKAKGATADELAKFREAAIRERETGVKTNGFWLGAIASRAESGEDLHEILTGDDLLQSLSPELIRDAARTYLNTNSYARFTLLPEAKPATPAPATKP